MPDELMLVAGISLGYRDETDAMNGYRTSREPLGGFAQFLGF